MEALTPPPEFPHWPLPEVEPDYNAVRILEDDDEIDALLERFKPLPELAKSVTKLD